ncbi:MAG TPA: DsrE family protein [Methylomirabilota bacterium]|nr:DsrE family protein [Methylomirabilota bacterium]
MDVTNRKLGLLLSTPPEHPNLSAVSRLSSVALDRGADVYLYLIDDGVRAMDHPDIQALADRGAKLFVCAYGCQKRKIPLAEPDKFTYCGLVVLTDLINGCERFLAFN